jgi:hypothetical protein
LVIGRVQGLTDNASGCEEGEASNFALKLLFGAARIRLDLRPRLNKHPLALLASLGLSRRDSALAHLLGLSEHIASFSLSLSDDCFGALGGLSVVTLYLLGLVHALLDAVAPLVQHSRDRAEGEASQQKHQYDEGC